YYDRVTRASGGAAATQSMFRLFMVPGMQHCEGGKALDYFDAVTPLVRWVEDGVAPDTLRASNRYETGFVGRERDLCAYPKVSVYRGRGSFDDPASFECRAP
ncbi:MAG: tannase/feruloyl esterase family alpha/beta hydrolase, partial [Rhizobacter sp.]|nr:tannase/feruloyl esterase family alpha/beta hydrolase [Rhizobacter sp.]